MKTLKLFSSIFAMFLALVLLVGCNISQSYADKINKAAEKDEHIEYSEVIKKLGEENVIDITAEVLGYRVGVVIGVKGLDDKEALEEKIEAGEKVEGIIVTIANGKAMSAKYGEINADDLKK